VAYGVLAAVTIICGAYIASQQMSKADDDADHTLQNNDASDCTGDCAEAKEKKEKEKIGRWMQTPPRGPVTRSLTETDRAQSMMRTRILTTLLETMGSIKEIVLGRASCLTAGP